VPDLYPLVLNLSAPQQAIGMLRALIAHLVARTGSISDDVWVVDSTPVECGRSRETAKRSDLAGWADYGYCATHSRFFWGLRLHLVCTLSGLPVAFALASAKADERDVLLDMLAADPNLVLTHPNQKLMADKNYYGKAFEAALTDANLELLRPARKGEKPRPGQRYFKPFRQVIESINNTLKTQLDLERHGGPHHRRRHIASTATHPGPHRRDLAQRPTRPAHTALANRLRPLTPRNYSSSLESGWTEVGTVRTTVDLILV